MEECEIICGVDFETTGVDATKDFITEIGAALFDARTWEIKDTFECFVKIPINVPPEITKLTGITDAMLAGGVQLVDAIIDLNLFAHNAKALIAHNAPFDEGFYKAAGGVLTQKWYCSNSDVPHVDKYCRKLSHLALDYGVQVDITKLHRALDDVKLMGQMLKCSGFTFEQIKAYADEPWVYFKANVSYNDRELAKADGFGWEKCHGTYTPIFPKTWIKRCKQSKFEEEKSKNRSFKCEVVQGID